MYIMRYLERERKAMENVKIRLVKEKKTFEDESGKTIEYVQYSLLFNDDLKTPIKPIFKKDRTTLRIMAEHLDNEAK